MFKIGHIRRHDIQVYPPWAIKNKNHNFAMYSGPFKFAQKKAGLGHTYHING